MNVRQEARQGTVIDGTTRVAGVIGDPVAHTLSPPMHNAAFASQGLGWVYVPFRVAPEHLGEAVRAVRALNLAGLNVTIPHKVAVLEYLDELDESARLIGAVNTIVNKGGRLIGYNTDGAGFLRSLRSDAGTEPRGRSLLLVGAGGAARAIGVQLVLEGASRVDVANRTYEKAKDLAQHLTQGAGGKSRAYALDELTPQVLRGYDVIVHTTSWGMAPQADVPPLISSDALSPDTLVCDIVYTPRETTLLRAAKAQGCRVLEGLGMLVHQAALAYELWTGQRAPVDVMYSVLETKLAERETD